MADEYSNDNTLGPRSAAEPDAHGRAAILLVESLIHGLIERKLLTLAEAVEVVDTATEVEDDAGLEADTSGRRQSITILQNIKFSLKRDIV